MNFDRLIDIREENDLTQEEVGNILGVSRVAVSQWETGKEIIPLRKLNIYANHFKVSLDYLCGISSDRILNAEITTLDPTVIGQRIIKIRKDNNLTLRVLADELNTTSSTISAYETGKNLILTGFAYQICIKYDVSMDWLCGKISNQ